MELVALELLLEFLTVLRVESAVESVVELFLDVFHLQGLGWVLNGRQNASLRAVDAHDLLVLVEVVEQEQLT